MSQHDYEQDALRLAVNSVLRDWIKGQVAAIETRALRYFFARHRPAQNVSANASTATCLRGTVHGALYRDAEPYPRRGKYKMPATSPTAFLPEWALWIQALGLPIVGAAIAFAGVWIARQQNKLADINLQNVLYDRRYKVYEAARNFLAATQVGGLPLQKYFDFVSATHEAVFLFKPDVVEYLAILRERATKLYVLEQRLKNPNLDQTVRGKSADEAAEHEKWFNEQFDILVLKFKPSLRLDKHSLR
jgi:hypothetical protein